MTASSGPARPSAQRAPYRRGDVVLVPFPFTERLAEKQRPAVVVSTEAYYAAGNDLIIAQITSRTNPPPRPGDHLLGGWREAGLPLPSLVRARVTTIHTSRVRRLLGTLTSHDLASVDMGLRSALGV